MKRLFVPLAAAGLLCVGLAASYFWLSGKNKAAGTAYVVEFEVSKTDEQSQTEVVRRAGQKLSQRLTEAGLRDVTAKPLQGSRIVVETKATNAADKLVARRLIEMGITHEGGIAGRIVDEHGIWAEEERHCGGTIQLGRTEGGSVQLGRAEGGSIRLGLAHEKAQAGKMLLLDLGHGVSLEMVGIPPGEFMMGSTPAERDWAAGPEGRLRADELVDETNLDELPRESPRKKTIHEGFWLGRTHVTVGQWRRFVEETGYLTSPEEGKGVAITYKPEKKAWGGSNTGKNWKDPSFGFKLSDDHPVSCINWTDAVAFCDWLNERDAKGKRLPQRCKVRLPTEAEWEYACRAGKQTKFWWGDLLQNGRGRLNMASTELIGLFRDDGGTKALLGPCWSDGFPFVSPVDHYGAKGRNGFDLADMVGNLWQWCMDGRDRNGLERHSSDYGIYECRAMRGGSFLSRPGFVRCASRRRENVRLHISDTGFRIAISANELSR